MITDLLEKFVTRGIGLQYFKTVNLENIKVDILHGQHILKKHGELIFSSLSLSVLTFLERNHLFRGFVHCYLFRNIFEFLFKIQANLYVSETFRA